MLRRMPTTADGKVVDRLQESVRVNKPFKVPSLSKPIEREQRKRKRVSYKGQDGGGDENDADADTTDGQPAKKKKKTKDGFNDNSFSVEEIEALLPKYPVFKPKPFELNRRFSMPAMTGKDGKAIPHVFTGMSLGTRPPVKVAPRPLHDPMEDHAIVLYDPTIDDRETDEERKEREKEEAKEKAEKEAREKHAGMFNPHKSLRDMLGEKKATKDKVVKVPVVIDPRLCKVLRPHQVEGVKVRYFFAPPVVHLTDAHLVFVSLCYWHDHGEPVRLHHGRRDGSRKDSAMHRSPVDATEAITSCR